MKNLGLAIPFDVKVLNENIIKRILHKIQKFLKMFLIRSVDILVSMIRNNNVNSRNYSNKINLY